MTPPAHLTCYDRFILSCSRATYSCCPFRTRQSNTPGSEYEVQLFPQSVILGALPFGSMLETFQDKARPLLPRFSCRVMHGKGQVVMAFFCLLLQP